VIKHIVFTLLTLALVLTLGSCKPNEDATVVGTWSLATIQGIPASTADSSGTLVVASGMTFKQNIDIAGTPGKSSGKVKDEGSDNYTFKYTDDITTPEGYSATLSGDGKTLSFSKLSILGPVTWSK
jgi:hypothetical protein